jgi:hypothetical protein
MALDRLEGFADAVEFSFVITRNYPNLAFKFYSNLCGTHYMPCRMKAEFHAIDMHWLGVGH